MSLPTDMTMQNPYDMAQQLIEQGNFNQAADQLEQLLRTAPDNAAAHNDLGVLQFRSGDHTSALTHLLQALRLEPTNTAFAENIIDVCHSLGMHKQAGEMEQLLAQQRGKAGASGEQQPVTQGHRIVGGIDFDALKSLTVTDRNELLTWYWSLHPRFRFLKSVLANANVLDLGAGGGGLIRWKDWLSPVRNDLKIYAVDLEKSELFEKYADFQICNLDNEPLKFASSFFDAAVVSHLLEHIREPKDLLQELRRVMRADGEVYVEVPTLESMDLPSRREFLDSGIPVSTVNFFDDSTHRRTFGLNELKELAEASGFRPMETGIVGNRFAEESLMIQGAAHNDEELCTYGIWSRLGFAHYIVVKAV